MEDHKVRFGELTIEIWKEEEESKEAPSEVG